MLRIGIIGCGEMGRQFVEPLIACRDLCRVTAAVDPRKDRAEDWARRHGGEMVVETDFRRILDRVDAVFCSLPHDLHAPVGMACLEAGRHVLMEKPMANSEAECLSMIETARRTGRILMVAMPIAYHPLVTRMRDILARREYGEIIQVSIWTEQKTVCEGDWRANRASRGGGQLFSDGCHYVDILLRLLGRPLEGMHMGSNHATPWMGADEGTSNLVIRFEGGPLGYHSATWGTGGTRLGYAIHAHCAEGMLEADIWEGRLRAWVGGPHISPAGENPDPPALRRRIQPFRRAPPLPRLHLDRRAARHRRAPRHAVPARHLAPLRSRKSRPAREPARPGPGLKTARHDTGLPTEIITGEPERPPVFPRRQRHRSVPR